MCLGIPGRVAEMFHEDDLLMGKVDFGGVRKRVCLEHVPEIVPGEYVLVHVGFALARLDEQEAARVFDFLATIGQLDELSDGPGPPAAGGPARNDTPEVTSEGRP